MLSAFRFIFFSSIETFALLSLMISIFRLSPRPYLWSSAFLLLIMNLISYLLRSEELSYLAPAMNTILYVLIITVIIRVPILWSAIMAASGMILYTLLQAAIILSLYGSFKTDMQYSMQGTIIQIVSSVVTFAIVYVLLRYRIGFTADFEKLRFKLEHILVLFFIIVSLITISLLMYFNNLYYIIIFTFALGGILIYYSIHKEMQYD